MPTRNWRSPVVPPSPICDRRRRRCPRPHHPHRTRRKRRRPVRLRRRRRGPHPGRPVRRIRLRQPRALRPSRRSGAPRPGPGPRRRRPDCRPPARWPQVWPPPGRLPRRACCGTTTSPTPWDSATTRRARRVRAWVKTPTTPPMTRWMRSIRSPEGPVLPVAAATPVAAASATRAAAVEASPRRSHARCRRRALRPRRRWSNPVRPWVSRDRPWVSPAEARPCRPPTRRSPAHASSSAPGWPTGSRPRAQIRPRSPSSDSAWAVCSTGTSRARARPPRTRSPSCATSSRFASTTSPRTRRSTPSSRLSKGRTGKGAKPAGWLLLPTRSSTRPARCSAIASTTGSRRRAPTRPERPS